MNVTLGTVCGECWTSYAGQGACPECADRRQLAEFRARWADATPPIYYLWDMSPAAPHATWYAQHFGYSGA